MKNLQVRDLPYEEAAGRALTLIAKYQAVTDVHRSLTRLANRVDSEPE